MAYFLGIDGGGSKTSCVLGDEKSVLGSSVAGGSNIVRAGEDAARIALHEAIRQACSVANINPSQIKRACAGLAGAARPEVRETAHRLIAEIIPGEVEIVGDMEIALDAAFGDGQGVMVTAGTGSIAYGRNGQGETARAGGWGFAISDEGSGYWIGKTAVATAVREGEQTQDTCLLKAIAKSWGVSSHQQIVLKANGAPTPDFAALFPVVLKAAEKQNKQAREVLNQAAKELVSLAEDVINQVFPDASTVPVAMSGGVFAHSSQVREVFYNRLSKEYPNVGLIEDVIEPVQGALQRARKHAR
ncbi:MAG TPA: BadF/BadG/BcrA/BcrD ATPase family protein [Terriglobales bacterium]|nr:BadF/BadG/BcrA/BcrD ATPase family protein [Terriglobales bacterium]